MGRSGQYDAPRPSGQQRAAATNDPGGRSDSAAVRRNNLSLVLRRLHDHGPRSRAAIAAETALNKATVSSLVGELMARGLIRETGRRVEGVVGRPAQLIELDGAGLGVLGLEVNVDYLATYATDLAGRVLVDRRVSFDAVAVTPAVVLRRLAGMGRSALAAMSRAGARPIGVTVAVPGLVDVAAGQVVLAPNLHWSDVPVGAQIAAALGVDDVPVRVENEANLAALAEYWQGAEAGTSHLVYVSGEIGVGGGVIVDRRLLRGADGFSGEVGHMPVDPAGTRCGCGRVGCWETTIGFARLIALAGGDRPIDPSRDPEERLAEVVTRAAAGDARAAGAFDEVGRWLAVGAAILVNLFNPKALVLGGYFARAADRIVPIVTRELTRLALAGDAAGCRVTASALGFDAAVRGAAGLVVEQVLDNPAAVSSSTGATSQSA
jgi:predicted NBD/HSP70 family sugar kinase